jgi:hypothetical protein
MTMFVCNYCHRKICSTDHLLVTYTLCQVCQKKAECVDCVAGRPANPTDERTAETVREWNVHMYRNVKRLRYPKKETP